MISLSFPLFKNKANNDNITDSTESNTTNNAVKRKEDTLGSVIKQAVISAYKDTLIANSDFIEKDDNGGVRGYIVGKFNVDQIGGLSENASKNDSAKGSFISLINGDKLSIFATEENLENNELIMIPNEETVASIIDGEDGAHILRDVVFDIVLITDGGAFINLGTTATCDDFDDILEGSIQLAAILNNKQATVRERVFTDDISDVDDVSIVDDVFVDEKPDIIDDELDDTAFESDTDIDDEAEIDDDGTYTDQYGVGDDVDVNPNEDFDEPDTNYDDNNYEDNADINYDDNDYEDNDTSDTDVEDIIGNSEYVSDYNNDILNDDELDIKVSDGDEYNNTDVDDTEKRYVSANGPNLDIRYNEMNSLLDKYEYVPFVENREDSWLHKQLNTVSVEANTVLKQQMEYDKNNVRIKYKGAADKVVNAYKGLYAELTNDVSGDGVQRYFDGICQQFGDINIDDIFPIEFRNSMIDMNRELKDVYDLSENKRQNREEEIKYRQSELDKEYNQKRDEYANSFVQQKQREYDDKYSNSHNNRKLRIANDVVNTITDEYERNKYNIMNKCRQYIENSFNIVLLTIRDNSVDIYTHAIDKQNERYAEYSHKIDEIINEGRKNDIIDLEVRERESKRNEEVEQVRKDAISEIDTVQKKFEAEKAMLQSQMERIKSDCDNLCEQITKKCEEEKALYAQREKEHKDEFTAKLNNANERTQEIQHKFDDLIDKYSALDEAKSKEYEKRMNEIVQERNMWEDKCSHLTNVYKRTNVIAGLLTVVTVIAAIAIGIIIGYSVNTNNATKQAQESMISQFYNDYNKNTQIDDKYAQER